jgi:hypothetical protein
MGDTLAALAFVIYLLGIPVSSGVMFKMDAPGPLPLLAAPVWPVAGLAYVGYKLAP